MITPLSRLDHVDLKNDKQSTRESKGCDCIWNKIDPFFHNPSIWPEYNALNEIVKLLISENMTHYSWQLSFDRLEEKGTARIITLFKMGLKEMPRLERAFLTHDKEEHKKAREEVLALFGRIDLEMNHAIEESELSPDDFAKEVKKSNNFTQEEWGQLARVPELIGKHHTELFAQRAYNTPKKRTPFFKV